MNEIKEFKEKNNGFISYSIKELIGGLHVKIDRLDKRSCKMDKRLAKGDTRFSVVETKVDFHKKLIFGLYFGILGTIITTIILRILEVI